MSHAETAECVNLVVTTISGHFQRCANPFYNAVIEPMNHGRWRRTQRRFCSDECRWDAWAIRRLKERLNVLSDLEVLKIILVVADAKLFLNVIWQDSTELIFGIRGTV